MGMQARRRREFHEAGLLAGSGAPALVAQARYAWLPPRSTTAGAKPRSSRSSGPRAPTGVEVGARPASVGETASWPGWSHGGRGAGTLAELLRPVGADDEHELGLRRRGRGPLPRRRSGRDAAPLAAAATEPRSGTGYGWNQAQRAHLAALNEVTAAGAGRASARTRSPGWYAERCGSRCADRGGPGTPVTPSSGAAASWSRGVGLSIEYRHRKWADDLRARYAIVLVGSADAADLVGEDFATLAAASDCHWATVREPCGYLYRMILNAC